MTETGRGRRAYAVFEVSRDESSGFPWALREADGETVAVGPTSYASEAEARGAAARVAILAPNAVIVAGDD